MNTRDDELDHRTTRLRSDQFDGSGFTPEENPPFEDRLSDDEDDPNRWHGGLDFGLLILRLALGGTIGAHGLQKLFGLFDGPGIGGFADALGELGYTSQTTLLAWITGIAEVGGGALLILGLFTPLGAAAVLGVTASAVYAKLGGGYFAGQGQGFEYEAMLSAVAFALLFTGSGRAALDKNTPWRRKPLAFGIVALLLAAAAVAVVIVLFR